MAPPQEEPKKEKNSLKTAWKKIKAALKSKTPKSSSSTAPVATTAPATDASKAQATADQPPELPVIEVDENIQDIPTEPKPVKETPAKKEDDPNDPQMRFNKAQAIFAKYNLELTKEDWDHRPKEPAERVSKPIRMRVRYTCHNCHTTFGHDRVCAGCQHRRCKSCIRYPPKKDKAKKETPASPTTAQATV